MPSARCSACCGRRHPRAAAVIGGGSREVVDAALASPSALELAGAAAGEDLAVSLVASIFSSTVWRRSSTPREANDALVMMRLSGVSARSSAISGLSSTCLTSLIPRASASSVAPSTMLGPLQSPENTAERHGTMVLRFIASGSIRTMYCVACPCWRAGPGSIRACCGCPLRVVRRGR